MTTTLRRPRRRTAARLATWRVLGNWLDGEIFLVVLGRSRADCANRLDAALDSYDYADFQRIETLWYERWVEHPLDEDSRWEPVEEIKLRRFRLLRAAQASSGDAQ